VSAGPDLRGGRGAALISWGRATESRVLLLFWKSFILGCKYLLERPSLSFFVFFYKIIYCQFS
jgi:hypothetical protein